MPIENSTVEVHRSVCSELSRVNDGKFSFFKGVRKCANVTVQANVSRVAGAGYMAI